jgi:hypothetical protein
MVFNLKEGVLDDKITKWDICVHFAEFELFGKYNVHNNTIVFKLIFVLCANIFYKYIYLRF